jgi:hypothetical protein
MERFDILVREQRIGRIRHRRIQVRAVGTNAVPQGLGELLQGIVPDAVLP